MVSELIWSSESCQYVLRTLPSSLYRIFWYLSVNS